MGYALPATVRRRSGRYAGLGRTLAMVGEGFFPAIAGLDAKSGDRFQAMQELIVYARLCRLDRGGEGQMPAI